MYSTNEERGKRSDRLVVAHAAGEGGLEDRPALVVRCQICVSCNMYYSDLVHGSFPTPFIPYMVHALGDIPVRLDHDFLTKPSLHLQCTMTDLAVESSVRAR
jgi:hypothetical protein